MMNAFESLVSADGLCPEGQGLFKKRMHQSIVDWPHALYRMMFDGKQEYTPKEIVDYLKETVWDEDYLKSLCTKMELHNAFELPLMGRGDIPPVMRKMGDNYCLTDKGLSIAEKVKKEYLLGWAVQDINEMKNERPFDDEGRHSRPAPDADGMREQPGHVGLDLSAVWEGLRFDDSD